MYLNILWLPFLGSLLAGVFGRFLGKHGSSIVTTGCVGASFILSVCAFFEVALASSPCYVKVAPWIESELFSVQWGLLFDSLTIIMLIIVTFVATLVHVYSIEYMSQDPHLTRFMSYLSLFTAFMLILVTGDNFMQMFLGWEGIGLSSYLLISFWFTRLQANKAGIKAMIINRVGDFGLALGIFTIYLFFQSVEYTSVFAMVPFFDEKPFCFLCFNVNLLNTIGVLLFVGALGKSAQIGLHTWLPDAMEGPTPVSALIHAATLVTAGVFLLARCSPLLEFSPGALTIISLFGAMTAFFAATTGLLQNDLKRVIAYSTCSQLGYMVFACGLSNYAVGVFHLANHAFFKALLFLSAGSVIHGISDEQDMRKMGGLRKVIPFTYAMITLGSLSLMGMPFLTGFYSKDVILEVAYARYSIPGHFSYWLGTFAAFFTAFYSVRLAFLTFLSEPNGYKPVLKFVRDSSVRMSFPLALLAVPSIFIGYLAQDMITGLGSDFWSNAIFVHPKNLKSIDAEFIPQSMKLLPVGLSVIGAFVAYALYSYESLFLYELKVSPLGKRAYSFLNRKWFFDKVYSEFLAQRVLSFCYHVSYKIIDRGIVEAFGPLGISTTIFNKAVLIRKLQTGYIYSYAFFIFIGAATLIALSQFWGFSFYFVDYRLFSILCATLFLKEQRKVGWQQKCSLHYFFCKTHTFSFEQQFFPLLK
jgi:NADH-ubiquinone oxidoreductase chain 5